MASIQPSKVERELAIIEVECPKCGHGFPVKTFEEFWTADVACLSCGYEWFYQGRLKRRIECPKCGSTKNEVSRGRFGSFDRRILE